ncbi:MAG: YIP1 family protein [candidate division Zixibacteria bacterium]|nr:YIP1 family protein [candidate division Zixibacteria bacterium]
MDTPSASAAPRSIWAIIADVFLAPTQAFESFKLKPTNLVPLILVILLGAIAGGLPYKQNAQSQIDLLSSSTSLPPQALEQIRQNAQNPSPITSTAGGAIVLPIITLIGALIAWFIGSFILGKKAVYLHVWGVILLADLISLVGGVLRSLLIVAKDSIYVSLGPAALLPGKDFTSILYSILYYTDIFAIWSLIVAGFGYAAIFGVSRSKGMTISVVLWAIGILFVVGSQLIGFSFAGVKVSFF